MIKKRVIYCLILPGLVYVFGYLLPQNILDTIPFNWHFLYGFFYIPVAAVLAICFLLRVFNKRAVTYFLIFISLMGFLGYVYSLFRIFVKGHPLWGFSQIDKLMHLGSIVPMLFVFFFLTITSNKFSLLLKKVDNHLLYFVGLNIACIMVTIFLTLPYFHHYIGGKLSALLFSNFLFMGNILYSLHMLLSSWENNNLPMKQSNG